MAGIHEPGSGFITGSGIMGTGSAFDWPTEERFWQGQFPDLSYINADRTYDFYQPAFRFGSEMAASSNRTWEEMESELAAGWDRYPHRQHDSGTWAEVRAAAHDAWHRYRERYPATRHDTDRSTDERDSR